MKRSGVLSLGFLGAFLLAGHTPAGAEIKFIPLLDASLALNSAQFDAEYATENLQQDTAGQQSTGENIYIYAAPNIGFTEIPGLWITPALEFEFLGSNNLLNLDDEAFIFDRRLNFYYVLGATYAWDRTWSTKLKGFGRLERAAETADETLETGIYNYNDAGAWGEISAVYALGVPMRSKLGHKAYQRRYPNYSNADFVSEYEKTVGPWPASLPRDMHEKDINVHETWLRQELTWGQMPLLTNGEIHLKQVEYTEMLVFLEDGTFSDQLREDAYLDGYLEFPWLINAFHQLEFDYSYQLRVSNTGFYDTNNRTYFGGYYNYHQNQVRLLYNYKLWFTISGFLPRGSVSFAWLNRYYYSRPSLQKVQTGDVISANYVYDDPHWERSFDLGLTLRQQLFVSWFNVFFSLHFISQSSNTTVEDAASYNYKYNTVTLGTAVSF